MIIIFNDQNIFVDKDINLHDLLINNFYHSGSYAVMLNRGFVPKSNYINIVLQDGDHVEIIRPMQGG